MSITRRQFLLGSTAGFILPSFYDKAFSYFENHREPLLVTPKEQGEIMYACPEFAAEGYQLNLGDPTVEPPEMTIREFCQAYGQGDPERWWRENWLYVEDSEPVDMEEPMDQWAVMDWWCLRDSSNARAYHYLEDLDLGTDLQNAKAVGALDFVCGAAPGVDYLGVEARDDVTLSLLQYRLNELGAGIKVQLL